MTVSGLPAPYEPRDEPEIAPAGVSPHSRAVALGLAVVGGVFGLHRFYTGRVHSGICMCASLGGLGIWYLYDVVVIAVGEFRDSDGRPLTRWEVADPTALAAAERGRGKGTAGTAARRMEDIEDRMLSLETQVSELAERLDFAERVLAQARERGTLPKS
ncbi:MAG TPA: TM2 domain-containing protein [Gemmatimonadales bacterium]|nr:TM2 domain-containing protein [Gemmatimonadales bacterium]